ncbi:hypothetical protein C6499_22355 [Candidatus Poribacteria bacterium]|nr:MAG: hypothetical protein C6499_22355 [Candidatus Poribacteria bacterium]
MDKKSILYLSHCGSSIGGGEKQLAYLVTNINREHYQPLVVCPDDGIFAEHLRDADIPVLILDLPPWRKAKSLIARYNASQKLVSLAKTHKAQLVHTSDSWFNPYLWYLRKRLKIPTVSHVRNLLTPKQVRKYKFDQMDSIIAISEQSKTPLLEARIDARKIDVILNCVDLSVFQPPSVTAPSAEYVVGIVGRIEPFKRQRAFVEIAAKVAAQCKKVRFHIIGAALDTPEHRAYAQDVRQLVVKHQLQAVVHFAGHRTDMPNAMQELDLLVTLSAGSVIAEAMAAGKPVIGTPIGSTTDMIVHGITGYVIPLASIDAIVNQIIELANDPTRSLAMGQRARRHAEKSFGVETHIQKVQDIYEKLLSMG